MAPALTQTAAEPPNLADAPCHSPDSNATNTSPYDHLKGLGKAKSSPCPKTVFESERILLSNGDCASSGLAPPACGWAEGRPVPNTSPCRSNMDGQPPLPLNTSATTCIIPDEPPVPPSISSESTMGLQSCITNLNAASSLISKGTEAATTTTTTTTHNPEDSSLNNQNELLALVGRDFDNVNDIIDTLQRLASNPELLDAAARDLEPEAGSNPAPSSQSPEDRAAFVLGRLAERQRHLERRRLFLLRRLRRVTARGLGMTVSSQLSHLTRHVKCVLEEERAKQPEKRSKLEEPIGLEMLHKESMKSMSTSDLISLVRRVEASNNLQRLNDAMAKKKEVREVLSLPPSLCDQLDTVASEMRAAALAHVSHDSDATESSSGGESCDEAEAFSNINTHYKPIRERAFYRYCRTRGWIASKWMWLQAQIADLDYRILQQQKLHTHLQKSKGVVQLAEETPTPKVWPPPRSPAHMDMQDPALTCIAPVVPRTVLNGYHHPSNKAEDPSSLHNLLNSNEVTSGCARTIGVERVRRRRYVRPSGTMSKRNLAGTCNSTNKVNRFSPCVFCKCVPPLTCILCVKSRTSSKNISFGNHVVSSSKLGAIALFNQSVSEKLSRVDQEFHPVLSRHSEMLQGELYNAVLKSSDWQQRALVNRPNPRRDDLCSNPPSNHFEPLTRKKKKDKEHKRNGRRKHAREDGKERMALKINKRSMLTDAVNSEKDLRETKRRKVEARNSHGQPRRSFTQEDVEPDADELTQAWHLAGGEGSAYSSPCQSPALLEKEGRASEGGRGGRKSSTGTRQKQAQNAYDINNIVIPYSMAATSRVEPVQYKEIPTPKWRLEEIKAQGEGEEQVEEEEDVEDVSLEATLSRHGRSEEMERKKFLQYLQTQVNSRSSRTRRADSSGTNTPDHPLSPRILEPLEVSPVGSPPDTPLLAPSEDSNHSSTKSGNQSTVLTLSLSSLQSSLLKSTPPPPTPPAPEDKAPPLEVEENSSSSSFVNIASLRLHKTHAHNGLGEPPTPTPALRAPRMIGGNVHLEKLRSTSFNEENENDRVSPYPCRDFPLSETDYEDLVLEDTCPAPSASAPSSSAPIHHSTPDHRIALRSSFKGVSGGGGSLPALVPPGEDAHTPMTDIESGRDSPLSELTDSAPEEGGGGAWEDDASPDWTISAVNDRSGGFVLTVQRN